MPQQAKISRVVFSFTSNSKIVSKSVNFGPILLQRDSLEGELKSTGRFCMLESPQVKRIIIMVTRSWKLKGPKSFLPPPQIFFIRRQKKSKNLCRFGWWSQKLCIINFWPPKDQISGFFLETTQKKCSFSRYETKN